MFVIYCYGGRGQSCYCRALNLLSLVSQVNEHFDNFSLGSFFVGTH